ncbi:MAG: hypothetical protein FWD58_01220 [Firmicutes bacterium]|nr:hypothetical protein [Bacillota bacterium]
MKPRGCRADSRLRLLALRQQSPERRGSAESRRRAAGAGLALRFNTFYMARDAEGGVPYDRVYLSLAKKHKKINSNRELSIFYPLAPTTVSLFS